MDSQGKGALHCPPLQWIKKEASNIGIIILTTCDTDDYFFRGIETGARAYLLKDSPPGEVLIAIWAVCEGESLIQPSVAGRVLDRFSELSRAPAQEDTLSPREVEMLQLVAKTTVSKEFATELLTGESTVKNHIILFSTNLESKDEPRRLLRPPGVGLSGFS